MSEGNNDFWGVMRGTIVTERNDPIEKCPPFKLNPSNSENFIEWKEFIYWRRKQNWIISISSCHPVSSMMSLFQIIVDCNFIRIFVLFIIPINSRSPQFDACLHYISSSGAMRSSNRCVINLHPPSTTSNNYTHPTHATRLRNETISWWWAEMRENEEVKI